MSRTVLIIDDEVDLCLAIRKYLNKRGYMVYISHSLDDGMKKLATLKPDMLLLDNQLPDGLGWKIRQIRFSRKLTQCRVAHEARLSGSQLSAIEFGKITKVSTWKLQQIESFLGVSLGVTIDD